MNEVPSKLEMEGKKEVYSHLILLGISSSMIMTTKNLGWGQSFT